MDIDDFLFISILPFIFGPVIFVNVLPVIFIILGLGAFREKGSLWAIFIGFIASFVYFRMLITWIVKATEMSSATLQYFGIFFLALMGIAMIFWNREKYGAWIYSSLLGFIWAFWIGLCKFVFADYYEPQWISPLEIYLALISSILPGAIMVAVSYILSKLFPSQYGFKILGILTLCVAALLMLNIVKVIMPRDELKPKEPPPVSLREIFHLK